MKTKISIIINTITEKLNQTRDIPLLGIRLLLAYAFYGPAMEKWNNMDATIAWFGNPDWGLGLPFPELQRPQTVIYQSYNENEDAQDCADQEIEQSADLECCVQ